MHDLVADTGKALHFDAMDGANVHRAGRRSNGAALRAGADAGFEQLRDKALDKLPDLAAEHLAPAFGALGAIGGSVVGLASDYKSAMEDAKREGELQRALSASDAGVTALAESLDVEASFKAAVAQAHAGSSDAAAAMTATLGDSAHASVRHELQLRADKGFVDAAGYAKMAATAAA